MYFGLTSAGFFVKKTQWTEIHHIEHFYKQNHIDRKEIVQFFTPEKFHTNHFWDKKLF